MDEHFLNQLFEGVYKVDAQRKIMYWNEGAKNITGYDAIEVIGKHCYNNILNHQSEDGTALCFAGCPLRASIHDSKIREAKVTLRHKDGHRVPVFVKTIPTISNDSKVEECFEIFTVIKEHDDLLTDFNKLSKEAYEDLLTGVSNRRYVASYIESKIQEFRNFNIPFGVSFIDIDNFKKVNDVYGHQTGDDILIAIASTIRSNLRSNDMIGRWGGEEFVIVYSAINLNTLVKITEKVRSLIESTQVKCNDEDVAVTASIGATMVTETDDLESIIARADNLMYRSKVAGKNRVSIY